MTDPDPLSVRVEQEMQPPSHIVDLAVEISVMSPCRSKRGAVVFQPSNGNLVSHGYNYKPRGFGCDGSEVCKQTCRTEAIHAEQQALFAGGKWVEGSDLLHVRTIDGLVVPSGGPSCAQCSKLALVTGIVGVWLFHETGWRRYAIVEFHQLSIEADRQRAEAAESQVARLVGKIAEKDRQGRLLAIDWVNAVARADAAEAQLAEKDKQLASYYEDDLDNDWPFRYDQ